ncbi:MAG: hypothetical protein JWN76_2098 [Chitinophagaceae bacterium]|nr:hypothetical protein [Chitinophagaceae bacterium]
MPKDENNPEQLLAELHQRTEELAVINAIQEGVAQHRDIQFIYNLVGDKIQQLFNAQIVLIATFDLVKEEENFTYFFEDGRKVMPEARSISKLRRRLINERRTIYIETEDSAINEYEITAIDDTEMPKSLLFVPLVSDSTAGGYISLQSLDKEHAYSGSDITFLETLSNSMAVALENARLFDDTSRLLKETEQTKAELAVINSVQEGLVREMSIEGIYTLVGNRIRELFNAQAVLIATFDHEKKLEYFNYHIEKGEMSRPEPRPFDKVRQHLIQTGQNILINENFVKAAAEFGMKVLPGTKAPKSLLFMPMKAGDKVTGYVSLQNIDQEHAFSFSDVRLLSTLANSMSVALQNAKLFDETNRLLKETEQQKGELAVINSVQEGLAKALDMQTIYDLVGNRIRDLFDAQVVGIATFDYATDTEHIHYLIEKGERYYPAPRPLNTLRKHLIETKEKVVINKNFETVSAAFGMKKIPGTEQPKSALYVPLVIGEKVTGYASLQNVDKEEAFSESDIRLLETLANTMGVALENARLFDETTRLLKETEQQKAELGVINSVQEGLAKELDMQAIYDLVGGRIQELFNAQAVMIVTFDHETATEHFKYLIEDGQRFYLTARPYDKLRQHLIITKQRIVINSNYEEAYAKFGLKTLPGTNPTKSGVFVPLIIGDKVNSYISLQNMEIENAFSESDVRLLETLANSMSVALENARLFDETNRLLKETEQRTAELAVINSVQEGLARELDMKAIYDLVGDRLCNLFPDTHALVIRTFDHENGIEHFQYAIEKETRLSIDPRPILWANKQLIANKKALYINENFVETSKKYGGTGVTKGAPPKCGVFVPMIVGDIVKGSISLQNVDGENAFSESDIRLLTTVTNSMSVALENARLFDETNRLLKETEQRTAELAVINSVQEGLAKELDMQGIYNLVGDRVQSLFHTHAAVIATFDLENKLEHFNYVFENGKRYILDARPINSLRQLLIDKKQTIYIDSEEKAKNEYGITAIGDTKMPKSLMFVPLLSGSNIKGYVSIQNVDKEKAFNESDIRLLETLANSMSVALENARLFDETTRLLKETEQRTAELAVINSVQEGLVREMDMKAIYELVGDKLCKLFPDTQTLVIRTFDYESGTEHWQYAIEKGERQYVSPRSFNWNSQLLIKTKKPLDIRKDYVAVSKKHGGTGVTAGQPPKSAVFVPMLVGDVVKGTVSLQNVDKENAFSDSDLRLLTTITNSMSVALENARLFDETNRLLKETEQRTAELAVINSVQEGLVREIDMQAIYETVGERLCDLFNIQTVVIRTFDHDGGIENWRYAKEKGERQQVKPRPFNWNSHLLIKTQKPLIINVDYVETAKKHGSAGVTAGQAPKSAVFVPMVVGDVVKGSVSLQNVDIENAFSDSDIRLLTTLTNSMSVALENARLFDETTHLLAEAKQRATELTTVNTISKALASQLNADELIQFIGDQMKDLFKANIVYLAILNKKTQMIDFPYQHGDDTASSSIKLGEGLTSKIILTGEPLLVNNDLQELRARLGVQQMGKAAASYLGVPIPVGDEIIGVLSVQSTEHENRFNESDLRLLSTIAASVGVALNNATLFEDVKQAKMEAESASKAAEKANDAKSAFLSTVSHELRTPLTSVLGFAKIIRKRLEEKIFPAVIADAKTQKTIKQISENLQVVISEGERLTHLINDVLDLAKIEAGKMEWNLDTVSMQEVAERALSAASGLFDQKTLKLVKEIESNLPAISGDQDKLIQVILNLISNAVKFTDKGTVTCRAFRQKDEVIVSIKDTGIGIAPEDFNAVFEQFKQVGGDTLTDKPKGTGLGLPICKEIIEHHGGRIWLVSEAGKGSTFSFALPLLNVAPLKPLHLDDLVKQLKVQMAHSTFIIEGKDPVILVVDDDDAIRSLLKQELTEAGYLVEEAANGKQALQCIRNNKPDLVILDVMMPEMNGFDVAAILKNDPDTMDIPIIVLSIIQDKTRGFRVGVDRYLTKPIDTAKLFSEVGSLLEQGKSRKKVMVVDEDATAVTSLSDVLQARGYLVIESNGKQFIESAVSAQPDIIILNSLYSGREEAVKSLRFEKGMENVLFLIYE